MKKIFEMFKYLNNLPAVRITILYVIFGFLWILLSDKFLVFIVRDPNLANQLQTYKGWFYILLTAFLLYHLVSDSLSKVSDMREDLEASERKYRTIFENYRDVYFELDSHGYLLEVSPSIEDHYGFKRLDVIGKKLYDIIKIDVGQVNIFNYLFKNHINEDIEITLIDNFGEKRYCTINSISVTDYNHQIKVIGSLHDVTDRKKNELYMKQMTLAVEQSPNITMITDPDGLVEYVNPRFTEITGYSKEEIIGRNPRILKAKYKREDYYEELWKTILSGEVWQGLLFNKKKNGSSYFESAFISPLKNSSGEITHYVKVANDITDLRVSEDNLKISLEEKENLLQEVYHRTKNNMQLISSILKMENRFTTREDIKPFIRSINNRIMAMSMIHDRVYQNRDINSINLKHYLMGFLPYLLQDYEQNNKKIDLILNLDDIVLNANTAITVGLLLNEMVSVSLYGYKEIEEAKLEIGFAHQGDVRELIYDDHSRLLFSFLKEKDENLSAKLIKALISQIKGVLIMDDESGVVKIAIGDVIQKTFNKV